MTPDELESLYNSRDTFPPERKAAVEELYRRAAIEEISRRNTSPKNTARIAEINTMQEDKAEIGPVRAFLIGAGEGLTTVGRGVGILDSADEVEKDTMKELHKDRPYSTEFGNIVGESAPFIVPGLAAGSIARTGTRLLASGLAGATEGGILSSGKDQSVLAGSTIGAAFGIGAEMLFPVIGKIARKIFQKVKGKPPTGSMLDETGAPSPELESALSDAGLKFSDLTKEAKQVISEQSAGSIPEQVARVAKFTEEGVPISKGETTKAFGQQREEQQILTAGIDKHADAFREWKLQQSEAIKKSLQRAIGKDATAEETGIVWKDALTSKHDLLRTQKNELYEQYKNTAEAAGGVPLFTDGIKAAIPDTVQMRRLSRVQGSQIEGLKDLLVEFGLNTDEKTVKEFIKSGGKVIPLALENVQEFRAMLGRLEKADITGSTAHASGPIKRALDDELTELVSVMGPDSLPAEIIVPLRGAIRATRAMKKEFDPKGLVGKIIDTKKNSSEQMMEASKVYDSIVGNLAKVEDVRKLVKSMATEGLAGQKALSFLQTTTMLDLIGAGFGTESRRVSGIKIFNPIAFKRRLKHIGDLKIKAIFENFPEGLKKIMNIDSIAADMIPDMGAIPQGSGNVILGLLNKFGFMTMAAKSPELAVALGALNASIKPIKAGRAAKKAMDATPDIVKMREFFGKRFPGIISAIGIPATLEGADKNE